MTQCKNGLGDCKQPYCVLETCPNLKEYILTRQQEQNLHWFWQHITNQNLKNTNKQQKHTKHRRTKP